MSTPQRAFGRTGTADRPSASEASAPKVSSSAPSCCVAEPSVSAGTKVTGSSVCTRFSTGPDAGVPSAPGAPNVKACTVAEVCG